MTKTTRIALAVLAACGATAAMAQSSVTIYGRVNTTLEQQKVGNAKTTGLYNNSSRIGFKGTEDLGNGLKAGFVLEAGFNSDDGANALSFARQSELNLSGNFGMVRLGNFNPESYYATSDYIGMHNHETGSSSDALYDFDSFSTSNKVAYRTPTMGNFWAEVGVGLHEQPSGTAGAKNVFDLAANYQAGNLGLGAGYSQAAGTKQFALRGLYTVNAFTFGAYYQRSDSDAKGTRNNYRLSAMYALGQSEFHVNVGRADKWSKTPNSGATQWTLGYNYNLSKRTKVYTYYTKVDNKAAASYQTSTAGADFSSFALGLRHNF